MVRYFCNILPQCAETALPYRSEVIPLKKLLCLLLCLALCCGLFTGCGEDDTAFIYAVSGVPDTLDPQLADSDAERILAVNLFEGLFRLNAAGEPVPAACESHTVSADGLTWTFTLRENLYYYTDPEDASAVPVPVLAEDFVFALRRLFDRDGTSPYRQTFLDIEGAAAVAAGEAGPESLCVAATGDRTLVIRLIAPDADLPRRLCCAGAMPCNPAF
jgi:ABC-type oligopeptide transport system substrate-binding subunit